MRVQLISCDNFTDRLYTGENSWYPQTQHKMTIKIKTIKDLFLAATCLCVNHMRLNFPPPNITTEILWMKSLNWKFIRLNVKKKIFFSFNLRILQFVLSDFFPWQQELDLSNLTYSSERFWWVLEWEIHMWT